MSVKVFLFFLSLFSTTICLEVQSQAVNGLDLPADPVPIKIQFYNSYSPQIYNIDHKTFPRSCESGEDEWFFIQTVVNGLVVDAADPNEMKLQVLTRSPSQLWKFERAATPGVYYIINNNTGAALDAEKDLTLKEKSGSLAQRWFTNWNGRIRSVERKWNLDVVNANFQAGNPLITHPDNGNSAQEFTLQPNVK